MFHEKNFNCQLTNEQIAKRSIFINYKKEKNI